MTTRKTSYAIPLILIGSMFGVLGFALGINAFFIRLCKKRSIFL